MTDEEAKQAMAVGHEKMRAAAVRLRKEFHVDVLGRDWRSDKSRRPNMLWPGGLSTDGLARPDNMIAAACLLSHSEADRLLYGKLREHPKDCEIGDRVSHNAFAAQAGVNLWRIIVQPRGDSSWIHHHEVWTFHRALHAGNRVWVRTA